MGESDNIGGVLRKYNIQVTSTIKTQIGDILKRHHFSYNT